MAHLKLAFLGAPEVYRDGRLLTFRTRKALALLVYLAVAGGRQSREKVTAVFWPESDEASGRASLRATLVYLRRALAGRSEEPEYLIVSREALGFNFGADFSSDLAVVAAAVQARQAEPLQAAVGLYRGDFLEGFTLPDTPAFDEWTSLQREYWHRQIGIVFDRLSQLQMEGGQTVAAIETVTRWLAVDPLHEPAYRRLMRLQLAAGQRTAAWQTYAACRAALAAELGVEPSPETQALAEHIRQDDKVTKWQEPALSLVREQSEGLPKGDKVTRGHPVTLPSPHLVIPFVGRSHEHTQLVTAFYHARRGRTQVVLLQGEAGIGKTRLAQDTSPRSQEAGD